MEDKNRTGEFLKELRKEKGYKQIELADKIHVTDKAISNWENGRSHPDPETMKTLAKFFDITVDELYVGARRDTKKELKRRKRKRFWLRVVISIFAIIFLLLLAYFVLTFNSIKFYILYLDDDVAEITGYYMASKKTNIFHFENLDLYDGKESSAYIELYEENSIENKILYSGFYSSFTLENIDIENLDNVYLKLVYPNGDEAIEVTLKINFQPKYLKNRFVNLKSTDLINYENNSEIKSDLVEKLEELGFIEQSENLYFKEEKNKKETITTYVDANIYTYNKIVESSESKIIITYYKDSDAIDVQYLDSKNSVYKEFRYRITKEILNCKIGRCDDVLDIESIKEDIEIVKLFK